VVSEIVRHLERDGLLERMRDAKDKRRTLVWLSDRGLGLLEREREVLSGELLARAMTRMKPPTGSRCSAACTPSWPQIAAHSTEESQPMTHSHTCDSCSMPSKRPVLSVLRQRAGRASALRGALRAHGSWQARRSPEKNREALEAETLAFMAKMPAWKDHPRSARQRSEGAALWGSSETAQFLPQQLVPRFFGRRSLNSTHLERRSYAVVSIPRSDSLFQLAAALLLACGAARLFVN